MTDPVRGELDSTGWIDWAGVRAVLGQDMCLWVDLGGVHHGPVPVHLPVGATHLWSWRPGRWARVRFDGDRALATLLTADVAARGEPVTVRVAEGQPWGRHSRAAKWDHKLTLLVTQGHAPITFAQIP